MKKNLLVVLSILAVVAAVPFLYADMQHGAAMHGEHGGFHGEHGGFAFFGHLQHLKKELDLTDDQSSQIQAIAKQVHDENAPFRDEIKQNIHAAGKLLIANPNDVAGAQAVLDGNGNAERQLKANILQGVSKALGVLTPEQRAKLADHLAKKMNRG